MDGLRVSIRVEGEFDAYPARRIKLFKEHFESLSLVYTGEQARSAWSHDAPAQGGAKLRLSRGFPRGHAQQRHPQRILARII
jgi:hypothetical protein